MTCHDGCPSPQVERHDDAKARDCPDPHQPAGAADRLAANPRSLHPVAESFEHESGIGVNGKARTNVEEHCIREGWVTIPSPKARECYGNPMQIAVKGTVGAFTPETQDRRPRSGAKPWGSARYAKTPASRRCLCFSAGRRPGAAPPSAHFLP